MRDLDKSVPSSTYRVQLTPDFGFAEAADLASYLAQLGVSHLYASPYLQAAPGSTHGYDVVDHTRVNSELGGEEGHAQLCHALHAVGLGQVLDIVPNHMAIGVPGNAWWWDVLENGQSSVYASYFDVDWDPPEAKLRNTVLLPILGDHYGRVLEAGDIAVRRSGGTFTVEYFDHVLPVAPPSLDALLARAARRSGDQELEFLARALRRLPPSTATDPASVRERHQDKEQIRARLAEVFASRTAVAEAVDDELAAINADPAALHSLLERQNYRLAFWRAASRDLSYRRFFDIDTLVGLRVEDAAVFGDTHRRILDWVRDGAVDGLRIDHPDGLRNPEQYLERLAEQTGGVWTVVEKILEPGERLPKTWAVAGTTGYDFLNRLTTLFVDPAGEAPLTELYAELTGEPTDYEQVVITKKNQVMREVLGADVNRLVALFVEVCERHPRHRDYTRDELGEALREVIASFPVYRTYVRAATGAVRPDDEAHVEKAVGDAAGRRPDIDADLLGFLRDLLLLRIPPATPHVTGAAPGAVPEHELVMRFQQLTGPVMAKGVEDTAFYTFNRFVALNEVGGDPSRFGLSVGEFHDACAEAQRDWPRAMLASSTHDTKRSEDVRARLALLSEIPDRWSAAVRRWVAHNEHHRRGGWPDRNFEYLLYQILVGAWPLSAERAKAYMEKASKEAKQHTSWTDPRPDYDEALGSFVEAVLSDDEFIDDFTRFVAPLVWPGRVTSLAQALIKLTAPGIPDIYRGTELWDLSLVDPDNRRPVDYDQRRALLGVVGTASAEQILARADEGLPKLHVTHQALQLRRERPDAFMSGEYAPLECAGPSADRVVAFARGGEVLTVAPRLVMGLAGGWGEETVALPKGRWRDRLTSQEWDGGNALVGSVLSQFPVALLERR
jgi:(1->4)-alpha-D-glucan 1-alpha-D-glucosylmutase